MPIEMPANIPQPHARPHLAPAKSRILETANELFYDEKTSMLFGDAKASVGEITQELDNL